MVMRWRWRRKGRETSDGKNERQNILTAISIPLTQIFHDGPEIGEEEDDDPLHTHVQIQMQKAMSKAMRKDNDLSRCVCECVHSVDL